MSYDLFEKSIVITGSSKGLGRELALILAKMGANVVINYANNKEDAIQTLDDIRVFNKKAHMVQANVSNPDEVLLLYKETISKFGKVDVLVNNAGIGKGRLVNNMSLEDWDQVINTNLRGCFLCCKQFSKQMMKQKYGKIINISSQMCETGEKGLSSYSSSKAGINSLTKTLAIELADYNISVNAICPGYILTSLNMGKPSSSCKSLLNNEHNLYDFLNFTSLFISDKIKNVSGQIFFLDSRI